MPTWALTNGFLIFIYRKSKAATDVECAVEVTSNLGGAWLSGSNNVDQFWQVIG